MKKSLFIGWKEVFAFTFRQDTKGKFKRNTIVMAVILLLIGMAISVIMALVQKNAQPSTSPIETVHVVDDSTLRVLAFDTFTAEYKEDFPKVAFTMENGSVEAVAGSLSDAPNDVILHLTDSGEGYRATVVLPSGTAIREEEAEELLAAMETSLEISRLLSSGIPAEKMVAALSTVNVTTIDAGEIEKSIGEEMVSMLLPMLVCFMIYFVVLIYGLTMGNAVAVEKTSKLMEMVLTMTRPASLVLGKILALTVAAISQLFIWVAAIVLGFGLGHLVSEKALNPGYKNYLLEAFRLLKEQNVGSAFSTGSVLLFLFAICVTVLFFFLLAATFGSFASKTEEVPQFMAYYQLITVFGFFLGYMVPLKENPILTDLVRFFPLSGAFLVPGEILVGNITLAKGALCTAILLAVTIGLVFLTGKVYHDQLFYRGQSVMDRIFRKKKGADA